MIETTETCRPSLTTREAHIIHCRCVEGMTIAESAYAHFVSPSTVKNQVRHLLNKLGEHGMERVCYRHGRGEFGIKEETA